MSCLARLRDISPDMHNSAATAVAAREQGTWPVLDLPLLAEAICELADRVDELMEALTHHAEIGSHGI